MVAQIYRIAECKYYAVLFGSHMFKRHSTAMSLSTIFLLVLFFCVVLGSFSIFGIAGGVLVVHLCIVYGSVRLAGMVLGRILIIGVFLIAVSPWCCSQWDSLRIFHLTIPTLPIARDQPIVRILISPLSLAYDVGSNWIVAHSSCSSELQVIALFRAEGVATARPGFVAVFWFSNFVMAVAAIIAVRVSRRKEFRETDQ